MLCYRGNQGRKYNSLVVHVHPLEQKSQTHNLNRSKNTALQCRSKPLVQRPTPALYHTGVDAWSHVPGGQLVLLLAGAGPGGEGQLAHRGQVADHLVQLAELGADGQQLAGVGSQVLHVRTPGLLQLVLS